MNCDWIGCKEKWIYKIYYDDVPIFYLCRKHYFPAIDFVVRDVCPIASEHVGSNYKQSVEEYQKIVKRKNQKSILKREEALKNSISKANKSDCRKSAKRKINLKESKFEEAKKVLNL